MPSILIVDDAAFTRLTLREILENNGYRVIGEAGNSTNAVEKFCELSPCLVIMDVIMPGENGIAALKNIIAIDPNALVIMCSALGQQSTVIESFQSGAKDFIVKPFTAQRIIESVKKVLGN